MPNRIIKESLLISERVAELKDFDFRLWISLILLADDYGCGDARPAIIKGRAFPLRDRLTNKDIESSLGNLAAASCVNLYEVDGRPYYQFPNWSQHQRVRNAKRRFPQPESATCDGVDQLAAKCGELPPESNPIQSESNPKTNPESESNPESNPNLRNAWTDERPNFNTIEAYASGNLKYMSPVYMQELADFKADFTDDVIQYAIDKACENGGRSWNYAKGVLNKCLEDGCKTLGAIKARDDAHRKAKQAQAEPSKPKIKFGND